MRKFDNIQLLVMQSTSFCNIDCHYCYLPDRNLKNRMTLDVVKRVAEQIVSSDIFAHDTVILWHAGEPLSVPLEWYRQAYDILQSASKHRIRFQFQSNGTLLNEEWVEFLKATGSSVGLSLDGPQQVHDHHRVNRRGAGTFREVENAAVHLTDAGIQFTVIATVTAHSLKYADEIFLFFYKLRPVSLGFSIEEAEGANRISTIYNQETISHVENFFARIAELNFASENPLRIREVESVLGALLPCVGSDYKQLEYNQETILGRIISIGSDGSIAFFSPELLTSTYMGGRPGVMGNICHQSFAEIRSNPMLRQIKDSIDTGVSICKEGCEYYRFCGGGSPANKLYEHGRIDVAETWFCTIGKKALARGVMKAIPKSKKSERVA